MKFIISAVTDVGIRKDTNQDSLSVKLINTTRGQMVFAVLCDGMGGLQKGEIASASVINSFHVWVLEQLPLLCNAPLDGYVIQGQWQNIICSMNETIKMYGQQNQVKLGTTAVIMLLAEGKYYIMNVGDSRAYELKENVRQITKDQTFVQREVTMGRMTQEQADCDPRKNILLQCVGASPEVIPEMHCGEAKKDSMYMLCSDGFRHKISVEEIYRELGPENNCNEQEMENHITDLIETDKQRMEKDNISVIAIRTY